MSDRVFKIIYPSGQAYCFFNGAWLTYCWWIWRCSNEFVFNGTRWRAEVVSGKAQADFYVFVDANTKPAHTPSNIPNPREGKWQRLGKSVVKINVDPAVSKAANSIGPGAIARGDNGAVLRVLLKVHMNINSPKIAETIL